MKDVLRQELEKNEEELDKRLARIQDTLQGTAAAIAQIRANRLMKADVRVSRVIKDVLGAAVYACLDELVGIAARLEVLRSHKTGGCSGKDRCTGHTYNVGDMRKCAVCGDEMIKIR